MFELSNTLTDVFMDPQRLPVAVLAILVTVVLGILFGPVGGDTNSLFNRIINGLFEGFGVKLERKDRKRGDLILRGFFLTFAAIMVAWILGDMLTYLSAKFPIWRVTEVLFLSLFLSSGAVWRALGALYKVLEQKKPSEGTYLTIATSTCTNLTQVDDFTITRTGIGLAIRSFDKGLLAPVFWYWLAGFPGVAVYCALAVLSWRYGRLGETPGFAVVPLALEKIMGLIPSILSAVLLSIACVFTPTAMMSKALKGWNAHKNKASYAFGGLPMTALAWGLNISTGGPSTTLDGHTIKGIWVGPDGATAQLEATHLHRVLYAVIVATILLLAALIGFMIISGHQLLDF